MNRRFLAVGGALLALLAFSGTADAATTTLGITTAPSGATTGSSPGFIIAQLTDTSATPFIVPSGGGQITQWQTLTAGDTAGSSLTLVVLRPTGGAYTVIGADTETLPNPLPASGVASFTLSTPISVQGGDTLGLSTGASNVLYFYGGTVPSGDNVFAGAGTASVGQKVTVAEAGSGQPYEVNLAATLVTGEDASVQTSVLPSVAEVGSPALLSSVVTNAGPSAGPLTFVEAVPTGVQIQSASSDFGSCTVAGQTVSCTLSPAAGQSANVNVIVTPSQAGSFPSTATVSVGSGIADPNSANNTATANLVVAVLPPKCIVPGLRKLPAASARTLLSGLGCTVRVKNLHSSITKGLVIGTVQKVGTYAYHQLVTLNVSSGPKARKRKKH